MPNSTSGGGEKPRLTFTLVHGTFARRADWVLDDADVNDFRSKLRTALPGYDVVFDAGFRWQERDRLRIADNTIAARQTAAERLERYILRPESALDGRRYIVAHSHGGNVAMYALRNPEVRARVDGLICLATPFLFSKPAPFNRALLGLSALLLIVLALDAGSWWMWTLAVAYALLVLRIGRWKAYRARNDRDQTGEGQDDTDPPAERTPELVEVLEQLEKLKLPTQQDLADRPGGISVLVIRAKRDEVFWLLKAARRAGTALRWTWETINRVGSWIVGALVLAAGARWVVDSVDVPVGLEPIERAASLLDRFVMTPMLIAASAVLVAIVIIRWFFAFDALKWVTILDTWSEDVPWPDADPPMEARAVDADESAKGLLRHSRVQSSAAAVIAESIAQAG